MTTGAEVRKAGGSEGDTAGHRKVAAAVTHILSTRDETSRKNAHVHRNTKRKRLHQQRLHYEAEGSPSNSEDEGDSPNETSATTTTVDVVASCRRLPDPLNLDHERQLQRIATTGVVQLFNAVSKHGKELQSKVKAAGPSERKKAKVLSRVDKGSFIDLLKGRKSQEATSSKWPVLKEDYMLKAKMRDWGKKEEGAVVGGEGEGGNSSSEND